MEQAKAGSLECQASLECAIFNCLYLLFGPKGSFLQAHAKESLNGQISYTLYGLVLLLLALTVVGLVLAVPLALGLLALALWNMVMGALAAGRGEFYRYALILRLVP